MFTGLHNATVRDILERIRPRLPEDHLVCVTDNHSLVPIAAGAVGSDEPFADVLDRHVWLSHPSPDGIEVEGEHHKAGAMQIIVVRDEDEDTMQRQER